MATPLRSIRPKCPECGFSVFNRRFAKCESCGAQLPVSIVYTADELKLLAEKDKTDEEAGQKALAMQKAGNRGNKGNSGNNADWLGDVDGGIDFDLSD